MQYCLLMHYQEGPEIGLTEEDMALDETGGITFRTKLRISFKIRPPKTSSSGS